MELSKCDVANFIEDLSFKDKSFLFLLIFKLLRCFAPLGLIKYSITYIYI